MLKTVALFLLLVGFAPCVAYSQTVSGGATLTANVDDHGGCGIALVQFFIGSALLGAAQPSPGSVGVYAYKWDTKTVANGVYVITAKATDKAGVDSNGNGVCDGSAPNVGVSNALQVTVNNMTVDTTPPSAVISITSGAVIVPPRNP